MKGSRSNARGKNTRRKKAKEEKKMEEQEIQGPQLIDISLDSSEEESSKGKEPLSLERDLPFQRPISLKGCNLIVPSSITLNKVLSSKACLVPFIFHSHSLSPVQDYMSIKWHRFMSSSSIETRPFSINSLSNIEQGTLASINSYLNPSGLSLLSKQELLVFLKESSFIPSSLLQDHMTKNMVDCSFLGQENTPCAKQVSQQVKGGRYFYPFKCPKHKFRNPPIILSIERRSLSLVIKTILQPLKQNSQRKHFDSTFFGQRERTSLVSNLFELSEVLQVGFKLILKSKVLFSLASKPALLRGMENVLGNIQERRKDSKVPSIRNKKSSTNLGSIPLIPSDVPYFQALRDQNLGLGVDYFLSFH